MPGPPKKIVPWVRGNVMRVASHRTRVSSHQLVFFAAGILGFGPAIGVLYHALRTYDYPFTEKSYFDTRRVILALAVGMIVGTISGAITLALGAAGSLVALVLFLILVALFEEGFKLIYLNRKGYRGRFDTTFVGVGLGIGIAAIAAAGPAYANGPALFGAPVYLPLAAFSVSLSFVHGATGAILGLGCSKGDLVTAFAQAFVARVLHAAILVPFFVWFSTPTVTIALPVLSLAAAIGFTIFLYRHVYRFVIPETLPPELRRERRRGVRSRAAKD